MRRAFILVLVFLLSLSAVSATDVDDSFNTLSAGTGYQYSALFGDDLVSFHGPGIALSNMNSLGSSGLYIYDDVSAVFPLSLSYGEETRERSRFQSLTGFGASIGAGWSGRDGIIRYFMGGGLQCDILALEVRCGSMLRIGIGVNATAGVDVLFTDRLFLECSVKAVYSFLDIESVSMSSGNDLSASFASGLGISGRIAIGVDLS